MSFLAELRRRNVFKVCVAYALTAWVIAQVVSVINEPLSLPDQFDTAILILLFAGFPIAIVLAWAYELTPAGLKRTSDVQPEGSTTGQTGRRIDYLIVGLVLGAIITTGVFRLIGPDSDLEWAENDAIPQIQKFIEQRNSLAAFELASELAKRLPAYERLDEIWPLITWTANIQSEPSGASVYQRQYTASEDDWKLIGVTPIENLRLPAALHVIRVELAGFETAIRVPGEPRQLTGVEQATGGAVINTVVTLDALDSLPDGMVRVPGWQAGIGGQRVELQDFFLGRYEVTNGEYKQFVAAGGYERPEFWQHPFETGETELSWGEAMALFVDSTGRPGPATWEGGDYPVGRENYPVSGVSWYEAAAYAKFAGVELPTSYHWRRAVFDVIAPFSLQASNLESAGPAPVGAHAGLNWAGNFDMTGNVREWTYNQIEHQRVILGGGWNDPLYRGLTYEGASQYGQDPMDRSETNGFRVALTRDPMIDVARSALDKANHLPDWANEFPANDDVFAAYSRAYDYDDLPLNASVESRVLTDDRVLETAIFDAAYGSQRMALHLYLPMNAQPPYQVVVIWPGAGALFTDSVEAYSDSYFYLLTSGRAIAFPVLNKTLDRRDGTLLPDRSSAGFRDLTIQWVNDIRRSLDYLETRPDVDTDRIAYFGTSWGGASAPNVLAIEPRFRVAVLEVAGMLSGGAESLQAGRELPEAYALNFLPRVTLPTLMLSGELDGIVPLETSAKPFFARLGTPEADKKHVTAWGGHSVPRPVLIRESLDWLDMYLGRPRR